MCVFISTTNTQRLRLNKLERAHTHTLTPTHLRKFTLKNRFNKLAQNERACDTNGFYFSCVYSRMKSVNGMHTCFHYYCQFCCISYYHDHAHSHTHTHTVCITNYVTD